MRRIITDRDGFTLVEVLTVMVIIAILAAVAIPTMSGFVSDARKKSYTAEARTIYIAAQAAATELVGDNKNRTSSLTYTSGDGSEFISRVEELLGKDITSDSSFTITLDGQRVETVEYITDGGQIITISGGESVSYDERK